jgi:hypothetical protein
MMRVLLSIGILVYELMDKEVERRLYKDGVASSRLLTWLVHAARVWR